MKGEKKGTKVCPDCLLTIEKDDSIIRYQGETVDEPGTKEGTGENLHESKESTSQAEPTKEGTQTVESGSVQQPGTDPQPQERGDILPAQPDPDHISRGLMAHPEVTVYAWPIGYGGTRGYRYGIQSPYPNPPWKKKMSGVEAFQFLSNIRNSNRRRKLEGFTLPGIEGDK